MKRSKLKVPEELEVAGCRHLFVDPPLYWTENEHKELSCDRCNQPLTICFAWRAFTGITEEDPLWWKPTSAACSCPGVRVKVREAPRHYRPRKKDKRQLELNLTPQPITELFPR
jgi:hypothetical protein